MTKKPQAKHSDAYTVYLTDRAVSDIQAIENYSVSNWGKAVAKKHILKFDKALKLLELNPELARPDPQLGDDLLFYRVEKHLLVSIRFDAGIVVLTVAHASRDLETILHELTPTLQAEARALVRRLQKSDK